MSEPRLLKLPLRVREIGTGRLGILCDAPECVFLQWHPNHTAFFVPEEGPITVWIKGEAYKYFMSLDFGYFDGLQDPTTVTIPKAEYEALREHPVLLQVARERQRQDFKWGESNHDPFLYLAILGEEVGEANEAALEMRFKHAPVDALIEKLVQVAAVAVAAVECLVRDKWTWGNHALAKLMGEGRG